MILQQVWVLVQVDNEYNQPDNDLVAIFTAKPTLEELSSVFVGDFYESDAKDRALAILESPILTSSKPGGYTYTLKEWDIHVNS